MSSFVGDFPLDTALSSCCTHLSALGGSDTNVVLCSPPSSATLAAALCAVESGHTVLLLDDSAAAEQKEQVSECAGWWTIGADGGARVSRRA